jgi:hypothetical protein
MPFMNYTTRVPVPRTISELHEMLGEHGAHSVQTTFTGKRPSGLAFRIDTPFGVRSFALPVNVDAVHKLMESQSAEIARRSHIKVTREQAERTAWRVIRDWLEAQLALIEAGMAGLDEIMLPYLTMPEHGNRTLYQVMIAESLGLPEPKGEERDSE